MLLWLELAKNIQIQTDHCDSNPHNAMQFFSKQSELPLETKLGAMSTYTFPNLEFLLTYITTIWTQCIYLYGNSSLFK